MDSNIIDANISSTRLTIPGIEFLTTEHFGIQQSGISVISGLLVYYRSGMPQAFQSNAVKSALFGQALYLKSPSYVYVDSAGTEFTFAGTSKTLTPFTVGVYVYLQSGNTRIWSQVISHGFAGATPFAHNNFRIQLHANGSGMFVRVTKSNGNGYNDYLRTFQAGDVQNGWVHVTVTFSSSIMKVHFNGGAGVQVATITQSYGTTGAYAEFLLFNEYMRL